MKFTKTEQEVLRELINTFASKEQTDEIEFERIDTDNETVAIEDRPAKPELVYVANAMAILNHAVDKGYTTDTLAIIFNSHLNWPSVSRDCGGKSLKDLARDGYTWIGKNKSWSPVFTEKKCIAMVDILKEHFPECETLPLPEATVPEENTTEE